MIRDLIVSGNVGFLATDKQFVILIKGNIHGPFLNKDWEKVAKVLREEE